VVQLEPLMNSQLHKKHFPQRRKGVEQFVIFFFSLRLCAFAGTIFIFDRFVTTALL
jgi:hypothetical protein